MRRGRGAAACCGKFEHASGSGRGRCRCGPGRGGNLRAGGVLGGGAAEKSADGQAHH